MKNSVIIFIALVLNLSLISCTAEDLPGTQTEGEDFAKENEGESQHDPPEENLND